MRSFTSLYLFIFLLIYIGLTLGVTQSIINLYNSKYKKKIKFGLIFYSILILVTFVYLYIYPNQPRTSRNYSVYFYFNSILFIDLITKLPILISATVGIFFKRKRMILIAGILISVGLAITMIYGLLAGNKILKITHYEISFQNLPKEFDDYKILQISDIHLGSFQKTNPLLENTALEIQKIKPDLILFTGDLVNNFAYEITEWKSVLKKITSISDSYSILGNHDYGDYSRWESEAKKQENFDSIVNLENVLGFDLLRNENRILKLNKDSIFLIGVENWGSPPFPQYANLEKAMKDVPANAFKILMSHDPAHWRYKIKGKTDIQLTLSGHTHGLQWGMKFAGIRFSLAYFIRKNWGGLYKSSENNLYVNIGLGTVGIPWRIDMPPEITVITLKRTKIDGK